MNLFFDLLEKGFSKETALPLAIAGGIAIGVTEVYQLKLFGAGFKRKVVEAIISKMGRSALLNMGALYTKNLGVQVAQETLQEAIQLSTIYLADMVEENPNVTPSLGEMVNKMVETATSSEVILGMGVLGIPSAVAVGVQTRGEIKSKEALKAVREKFEEQLAKAKEKKVEEEKKVSPKEKAKKEKKLSKKQKFINENIEELAKDSVPLVEKEEIEAEIGERVATLDRVKNKFTRAINKAKRIRLAIKPMDVMFDVLDGIKNYKGANFRIFKRTIDKAWAKQEHQRDIIMNKVLIMADKLKLNEADMEAIGVWAALNQKGGKKKLIANGFTSDQLNAFKEKGLTENQGKLYNLMRSELEKLKPQILKIMKEVYGKEFEAVENYFPFMADFEKMIDFEIQNMFGSHADDLLKKLLAIKKR